MKKYAILIVLAIITLACGSPEEPGKVAANSSAPSKTSAPAQSANSSVSTADIDAKKIWKIRCVACHGLYGNQGLNGAANLQEVTISLAERINIITNGRQGEKGVMTAFGDILTEAEIKAVAEYTMTFNKDL